MSRTDNEPHKPSTLERIFAFLVAATLIGVMSMLLLRETPLDDNRLKLAMVLMAVLALALGVLLPGLLNLTYKGAGLTLRAAGGGAMFLLVLYFGLGSGGLTSDSHDAQFEQSDVTQMIMNARRQLWGTDAGYRIEVRCSSTGAVNVGWNPNQFAARNQALQACERNCGLSGKCEVIAESFE